MEDSEPKNMTLNKLVKTSWVLVSSLPFRFYEADH